MSKRKVQPTRPCILAKRSAKLFSSDDQEMSSLRYLMALRTSFDELSKEYSV